MTTDACIWEPCTYNPQALNLKGSSMFNTRTRRLVAIAAVFVVGLLIFLLWPNSDSKVTPPAPRSAVQQDDQPTRIPSATPVLTTPVNPTIEDQLKTAGYSMTGTGSTYSSDARAMIHTQVWQGGGGKPTVNVTDHGSATSEFVIDDVSFGPTAGHDQFWCTAPTTSDAADLAITISAAETERTAVQTGADAPKDSGVPGTEEFSGATTCYMK